MQLSEFLLKQTCMYDQHPDEEPKHYQHPRSLSFLMSPSRHVHPYLKGSQLSNNHFAYFGALYTWN